MVVGKEHKRMADSSASLLEMMNEGHKKKIQEKWEYIQIIAEVLLLTVAQNIVQRGHWEWKLSKN